MYFIIRFYHYFNTDSRCFKEKRTGTPALLDDYFVRLNSAFLISDEANWLVDS